ncbi:MAG: hypothetical protein ACYCX4_00835 [Bacillota bacterium]
MKNTNNQSTGRKISKDREKHLVQEQLRQLTDVDQHSSLKKPGLPIAGDEKWHP